ncbi:phage tail protein [Novosphingobium piscinae]|uniref:Tip attachment protein J domain-containing protein n=1 Tax=Novosphingobium piscinae TaxID=1507448 RepID=A0A7X1G2R9_9SPHN|nr:phage tail protein [Novosphingobium piscinae]MBC2670922.1 hypothetical protein [Novosphingobium piscinae]
MATVIFSALGQVVGGPVGAALGALVGRQVDGAVLSGGTREGPRLRDLALTTSGYGEPVPRCFGRMRVGGSIIWAADLRETRATHGGGKGRPAQTTFSYAASFAVALSSRPLAGLGRIWADGSLLRGAAGDLKAGGQLRFHAGHGDQLPDPLIAAAEDPDACPAFRGLAYVVFEDLPLGDFGNRLPALSFEVFGPETALDLSLLVDEPSAPPAPAVPLTGLAGLMQEGPAAELLGLLGRLVPYACDVTTDPLRLRSAPGAARPLPEAAAPGAGRQEEGGQGWGGLGGSAAVVRRQGGAAVVPLGALQYHDVERDYQAGLQRAPRQPGAGQPGVLSAPLAMAAPVARQWVAAAAQREVWAARSLVWRTAVIDPQLMPGAIARVPGEPGLWRVAEWEWQAAGVELTLSRLPDPALAAALDAPDGGADPGRGALARDQAAGPTTLAAFELPWEGPAGRAAGSLYVAAASAAAGWSGAALYAVDRDGGLELIGSSGRRPATLGTAVDALPPASSLLPDRASQVTVALLGPDTVLAEATGVRLAQGANRALLGDEIIQFARAEPLGAGRWQLSGLLRGRGGTEAAAAGHAVGERFVLLDDSLLVLDGTLAATADRIAAIGLVDPEPVTSAVALRGIGARPLAPVHPRARALADGALALSWTRRARGAWRWADEADVPLHEEAERYAVELGAGAVPLARWEVGAPALTLSAETVRQLRGPWRGAPLQVRQLGAAGPSWPTLLIYLD